MLPHRRTTNSSIVVLFVFLASALMMNSCGPSKETASTLPSAEKKANTSTVKILSINVRHTLKEKSDVRRLSKLIKSTAAEIVAVQQIERPEEGKTGFDPVKELAKQTEMYDFFGKARFLEGFDSGNAILSMYPVTQTTIRQLPVGKGKVRRSLAFGIIDVGLREIAVASTELDDQSSSERVDQAEEIFSVAQSYSEKPFLVCGNFCEPLSGKAAAKMQEHFIAANLLQGSTANTEEHLYTFKDSKIQPISVEKLKFGASNDALLVTIQVSP